MKSGFYSVTVLLLISAFILLCRSTSAVPYKHDYSKMRSAIAVFYTDDGLWGSVAFHQFTHESPVAVEVLLQNVDTRGDDAEQPIHLTIHQEPVHFDRDLDQPAKQCTLDKLESLLPGMTGPVGNLSERHNAIIPRSLSSRQYSFNTHDYNLTLFEGYPGYIINKSLRITQGPSWLEHKCSTIEISNMHYQRAGHVPCEWAAYSDCLVGAAKSNDKSNDTCVFATCVGVRRMWQKRDDKGELIPFNDDTMLCKQIFSVYPKPLDPSVTRSGIVPCQYASHSLLYPATTKKDIYNKKKVQATDEHPVM